MNQNPEYKDIIDQDTFHVLIGSNILTLLYTTDILKAEVAVISYNHRQTVLGLVDDYFLPNKHTRGINSLACKLPIIVKPNRYSRRHVGGYLLNGEEYHDQLFIDKKGYKEGSELASDNKVYDMINSISNTPFRINKGVLDFLDEYGEEYGLILNPDVEHKFVGIEKKKIILSKAYTSLLQ